MKGSFADTVYRIASAIPEGRVATYGQLARLAGNANAARAVGMLMSKNKDRALVPCHRVVAASGELTGYAFGKGTSTKKNILKREGVQFVGEKVDLVRSGWETTI